jgi:hypothetical protein
MKLMPTLTLFKILNSNIKISKTTVNKAPRTASVKGAFIFTIF